jgi:hypothetical protein
LKEKAKRVKVEINLKQDKSRKKRQRGLQLKEMAERVKVERNGRKG